MTKGFFRWLRGICQKLARKNENIEDWERLEFRANKPAKKRDEL